MSMYPKNEELEVFGKKIMFPAVDEITGKFTNGDFNNPEKLASFIPAETINLILDNLESVVKSAGLEANNFEQNQLLKAIKNIMHPIGTDYIQIAEDNGTFDINKSPAVLFGGTWSIRYNGDGVAMRTEGGNAEDGGRNGRGIQGDAIRNIKGSISQDYGNMMAASGVFLYTGGWIYDSSKGGNINKRTTFDFDASRVVPTGLENRMINIKMRLYRKIAN